MLPWGTWARLSFVMASGVALEDGVYVVGFLANDETFHQVGHASTLQGDRSPKTFVYIKLQE